MLNPISHWRSSKDNSNFIRLFKWIHLFKENFLGVELCNLKEFVFHELHNVMSLILLYFTNLLI